MFSEGVLSQQSRCHKVMRGVSRALYFFCAGLVACLIELMQIEREATFRSGLRRWVSCIYLYLSLILLQLLDFLVLITSPH